MAEWRTMTPEQKLDWLSKEIEQSKQAQALLQRFERLAEDWKRKIAATQKQAAK